LNVGRFGEIQVNVRTWYISANQWRGRMTAFHVRRDKAALFQILWGDRRGSVKVPLCQT